MTRKRIAIILAGVLGVVAAALVLGSVLHDGGTARANALEACCYSGNANCLDMDPTTCSSLGGDPVGTGSQCLGYADTCLPDGSCNALADLTCQSFYGYPAASPACLGDSDGNGIDDGCPGGVALPPLVFPVLPLKYEKVSMPDFGQHSQSWCWVGAAANSFYWFDKNGYPNLVLPVYERIYSESRNASGIDFYDPHDVDGDTITFEPDGVPDHFDYKDRPEDPQTTGNVYDGTCGDFLDNDVPQDGTVDFRGLIFTGQLPDPDCTSFAAPLGDDDSDTLVDEDPIEGGVDDDGDSSVDEDDIDDPPFDDDNDGLFDEDPPGGLDNDADGVETGGGAGSCADGIDNGGAAAIDCADPSCAPDCDEDGVVGYRGLLERIAGFTWHDTNQDGLQQLIGADGIKGTWDDEPRYVYSEPVEKWDYLCGLQNYIDGHGGGLKVHDILHPSFVGNGITPANDNNHGANIKNRPGLLPLAAQLNCGITQRVKTPTFTDYKRELSRSQDVLVWMCTLDPQTTDVICHVVTGQAYDTTLNPDTITVSDPWTHSNNNHEDTWGQWSGPDHNNDYKHDQNPYDTCTVVTPGKDDGSEDFDITCPDGLTWTVVDLIFVSPPGPDIKIIDWGVPPTVPSPITLTPGHPEAILVEETKHNNGPMPGWSAARWTAIVEPPTGLNVRWIADPGDTCTLDGNPVDCATAPTINDLEFPIEIQPVSYSSVYPGRYLELEAYDPGNYTVTLINEEWPIDPDTYKPLTDPDPTNNTAVTTVYVTVPPPAGVVDKAVLSVEFDEADAYPGEGTAIPTYQVTVKESENVAFSVTSEDINYGPDEPSDAEISFYLDVPQGCSARWYDPNNNFPRDIQTIGGDINVGSSGTSWFPPVKEPGPVMLDLHFQTAEYDPYEPVAIEDPGSPTAGLCTDGLDNGQDGVCDAVPGACWPGSAPDPDCVAGAPAAQRYTRFFELHCYEPGTHTFTVCNRADTKYDTDPEPENNLWCDSLFVDVEAEADKEVLEIRFDEADNYPGEGTPIEGPPYEYVLPADTNRQISITSKDVNKGPGTPEDSEISFYAWVPDGCKGQFQDPGGLLGADVYTLDGSYTSASSGTVVTVQDKVLGPRWVDLHFQTDFYGLEEPVNIPQDYTRFFGLHCFRPGFYTFTFCNRADPKPPYTDPVDDNVLCEDLTVWATGEADLEKVDLYVHPFYCADSDMDGAEDGGAAAGTIPFTGNCCDGVDNDGDTQIDGQDPDCWPYLNEDGCDPAGGPGEICQYDDDADGFEDEDPPSWPSGQTCPWNGDDDCDSVVDEDPKNDENDDPTSDSLIDEDPANGFLGIDNDNDGYVDEDGAGNYDWDGDTVVDEVQLEGVDDDGDTDVDEDPLDSPVGAPVVSPGGPSAHEPHYLIKELLINWGPDDVWAVDTKEIDAPAWRADALEDGFTTCNDGLDNDGDGDCDSAPDDCWPNSDPDPECLNEHIGEEKSGLHSCNDGLDNSTGWGNPGDGLIDELDPDCETLTEASVECADADDVVTVKTGVPYYYKPPSTDDVLLTIEGCEDYYDSTGTHFAKCVPCKVYVDVGPLDDTCLNIVSAVSPTGGFERGYCIAVDAVPDVYKELDFHTDVYLPHIERNLHLINPPGVYDPVDLAGAEIGSQWEELWPDMTGWDLTSWEDGGDGLLSVGDQIDMEPTGDFSPKTWFHIDQVTQTVCLDGGPTGEPKCIEPLAGATVTDPIGPWHEKWPTFSQECTVTGWDDTGHDGIVNLSDFLWLECPEYPLGWWWHVSDSAIDIWVTEKVKQSHQFDLTCEGEAGEHKFIIQNDIQPPAPYVDPNPANNDLEMEMLVECVAACSAGIDTDGDTFNDEIEWWVGTDCLDDCPDILFSDDAWPLDVNMDRSVSLVGDVLNYVGSTGSSGPPDPVVCPLSVPGGNWWKRLDLNRDCSISLVGDVLQYVGNTGTSCTP